MTRFRWMGVALVAAGLLMSQPAMAQDIVISKGGQGKTSIDLSGFRGAGGAGPREFVNTLREDLVRSGWFVEAPPGRAEVTLAGSVAESGGRLRAECIVQGAVTRRTYLSKAYTATDSNARRFAHQVADAIVLAVTKQPGMASGRLVMVGTRSGKKELYLSDADGRGLSQLTQDKTVSVAPKWGAHNQIVYTSYLKGYPDVYLINVGTGDRRRISSYSGLNTGADLSPDGRDVALVLSKDGNPELYVKSLTADRLTRLTTTRQMAEASPSWSPDGSQIAYVSDSSGRPNVYIIARNGGRPRRISSVGSENVAPDWGRNGQIVYSSRREGRYQIVVHDPSSGETRLLDTGDQADYESPSWAPDGRHLACSRTQSYRSSVYILDTLGDRPIALSNQQGDWYSPSWSP